MNSLIKRDFMFTFKNILTKYILIGIAFFMINFLTIGNMNKNYKMSITNFIFESLKGVPYFDGNDGFKIPMVWFIINFFVIFSLANYIYEDLKSNGRYILARVGKIEYFYFSKIIWAIFNVFIYYIILFLIMIISSKIWLSPSNKLVDVQGIYINRYALVSKIFLLYFTTSTALVLLQNTLSLILKPVYSYLVILFLIAISVFTVSNLLPGQHSLILRHVPFDNIHGLEFDMSMIYNIMLSLFSIIAGYFIFLKKDFL